MIEKKHLIKSYGTSQWSFTVLKSCTHILNFDLFFFSEEIWSQCREDMTPTLWISKQSLCYHEQNMIAYVIMGRIWFLMLSWAEYDSLCYHGQNMISMPRDVVGLIALVEAKLEAVFLIRTPFQRRSIAPDKALLWLKTIHIFLSSPHKFMFWVLIRSALVDKNICCGYSLEAPHRGTSNEYPQHIFLWRSKNYLDTPCFWSCGRWYGTDWFRLWELWEVIWYRLVQTVKLLHD